MEGTPTDRGVNFQALNTLFQQAGERSVSHSHQITISMVEIYNEQLRDLLAPAKSIESGKSDTDMHESNHIPTLDIRITKGHVQVPGLTHVPVSSVEEAWCLMEAGKKVRSVSSTNMNEHSSRSHCLLTATIICHDLESGSK